MRWACLVAAALCWGGAARADEGVLSGTLAAVAARGSIRIGTRDSAIPFSFHNKGGQPVGFSVDLCHRIAEDVAAALNRDLLEPDAPAVPGLRIEYVPVSAEARLQKVIAGDIDLECGSTTATEERVRTVAFSPVFFLAGTKLMVAAGSAVGSYQDLAGRTVSVSAGTTNAAVVQRLASRLTPPARLAETSDLDAAYAMLAAGQAEAFASDDILLAGLLAARADGQRFRIVGDYLSYEPYAIMLRRDDADFAALVRQSFERMAEAGTLRALYGKWFMARLPTGGSMNLPMSAQLAEMYRALGEPD